MKNTGKSIDFSAMPRQEIEEYAVNLTDKVEQLSMQLSWYEEQIRLSRQKRFGASMGKFIKGSFVTQCFRTRTLFKV